MSSTTASTNSATPVALSRLQLLQFYLGGMAGLWQARMPAADSPLSRRLAALASALSSSTTTTEADVTVVLSQALCMLQILLQLLCFWHQLAIAAKHSKECVKIAGFGDEVQQGFEGLVRDAQAKIAELEGDFASLKLLKAEVEEAL